MLTVLAHISSVWCFGIWALMRYDAYMCALDEGCVRRHTLRWRVSANASVCHLMAHTPFCAYTLLCPTASPFTLYWVSVLDQILWSMCARMAPVFNIQHTLPCLTFCSNCSKQHFTAKSLLGPQSQGLHLAGKFFAFHPACAQPAPYITTHVRLPYSCAQPKVSSD